MPWVLTCPLLPMTDDPVFTKIETYDLGVMDFQEYFVLNKFQPKVKKHLLSKY